jgi:hypothetical protein
MIREEVVRLLARCLITMLFLLPGVAFAQTGELIVEKKTFELPSYTTVAGATIKNVKIGWESAGTLNADKSNAILVTHFFSGTSHLENTRRVMQHPATGTRLSVRARRSIPTNISCCRRIHWSISTSTRPTW